MNWRFKVAAFKLLSTVPGGAGLYQFCQAKVTHSLDPTPARVNQKLDVGLRYWDWLATRYSPEKLRASTHLDFGAGWHPTIPLLYYCMGMERQWLFDVRPLLNRELIDETITTFRQIVTDKSWPHRSLLHRLPEINRSAELSGSDCLRQMGMVYRAPSAAAFPEIAGGIDVITCTQVLYYIGRSGLSHWFQQLHGSLKPGGKFMATIHLNDTHATPSNGLSQYNHLRYSPAVWERLINSPLMSHNRLKAPDYRELLEQAGFRVVHFAVEGPTPDDLRELDRIPIHSYFNRYTREELGARHLFFVAEKP